MNSQPHELDKAGSATTNEMNTFEPEQVNPTVINVPFWMALVASVVVLIISFTICLFLPGNN